MTKCFTDAELSLMDECVNLSDDELAEADRQDYEAMRGNSQQMSEAEITAQMAEEAKPEYNAFFGDDVGETMDISNDEAEGELFTARFNNNLSGDPIARGLTSDEEDAEVGRLWGIDASRVEFGE